ncbi:Protein of unknown function [Bacillus cereus]|nr:Protein of unknown function [Bacillus cereus]SCV18347.1 Protein of unknown function [Bacillus cereus]
MHVKGSAREKR